MYFLVPVVPAALALLVAMMCAVERWLERTVDVREPLHSPAKTYAGARPLDTSAAKNGPATSDPAARSAASNARVPSSSCIASTTGAGPNPRTGSDVVLTAP